jgi:precorrin isomerase
MGAPVVAMGSATTALVAVINHELPAPAMPARRAGRPVGPTTLDSRYVLRHNPLNCVATICS